MESLGLASKQISERSRVKPIGYREGMDMFEDKTSAPFVDAKQKPFHLPNQTKPPNLHRTALHRNCRPCEADCLEFRSLVRVGSLAILGGAFIFFQPLLGKTSIPNDEDILERPKKPPTSLKDQLARRVAKVFWLWGFRE